MYVQDFKVAVMHGLPTKVRCQFVDFAADVMDQHQSKLTDLSIEGMIAYEKVSHSAQP